MRVKVLFFGILRELVGRAEEWTETGPERTVSELFQRYAQRYETLREKRPSILFARNGEFTAPDSPLAENDEIAFLPPVSGGSQPAPADTHVFAITRDPIDSQALARAVQRPEDGAVVIFEGVVRNNTKDRSTEYLEYECYEKLALEQMRRIAHEVVAAFSLGRVGIIHRLGRLEVGEASVVIVASAPHRRPAFEGALAMIDRLKREVPIWKKEYFSDGAVWVEGEWDSKLLSTSSQTDAR
jgi:MoaE-MoaD fusion protein